MSIRTGTRVEQLHALRSRAKHNRDIAIHRGEYDAVRRLTHLLDAIDQQLQGPEALPPRRHAAPYPAGALLASLGVTARQVKEWAVSEGLLEAVVRGRVGRELVQAYADHHEEATA